MKPAEYRNTREWQNYYNDFKRDPILFARVMFPGLTDLPSPDFHYELADDWLNPNKSQHVVIAPRDHGKSALAQVFLLHHIIFDEGEKFVLIISQTQRHSKRLLRGIKYMINDPKFQTMFGHLVGREENAHKWNDTEVVMRLHSNKYSITTLGTGQTVRGAREGYTRFTRIFLDDPESESNTKTSESMESNYEYVVNSLVPSLSHRDAKIWVIGTPLHQRSMVMRLKDRIDWTHRRYSAEKDPDNEEALWPEKFSWDRLMQMREAAEQDNKLSSYVQEYCCTVISDSKQLFRPEDIRYYEGEVSRVGGRSYLKYRLVDKYGRAETEWKKTNVNIYTGIDPATSTRETADYFVIFHIAVTPWNDRFVLPYFRDRLRPSDAIEQIVYEYRKFKPERVSIETTSSQEIFRDVLRRRDDVHIPGLSVKHNPKAKKEMRHMEGLEPWFSAKKMFLQKDMNDLLNEMAMWPKGSHDDLLDGFYYANLHARPPKAEKSEEEQYEHRLLEETRRDNRPDQSWMLS